MYNIIVIYNFKKITSIISGKWFTYYPFGLNMFKQKSNTYIYTASFNPTSPNLASQTINPFTEPSVYTSIHEKNITIYRSIEPFVY
jgi:hypothetical protein